MKYLDFVWGDLLCWLVLFDVVILSVSCRFPFTLSSKFRYSGRTEFQTVKESSAAVVETSGGKSRWERGFLAASSRRLLVRQTLPLSLEKKQQQRSHLLASPEHSSIGHSSLASSSQIDLYSFWWLRGGGVAGGSHSSRVEVNLTIPVISKC